MIIVIENVFCEGLDIIKYYKFLKIVIEFVVCRDFMNVMSVVRVLVINYILFLFLYFMDLFFRI